MINDLIKYQQWRTGQIAASLDEIGLTPAKITACINWAIESLTNDLAAHDAEVAAKAVDGFIDYLDPFDFDRVDLREKAEQYTARLRAKAAK